MRFGRREQLPYRSHDRIRVLALAEPAGATASNWFARVGADRRGDWRSRSREYSGARATNRGRRGDDRIFGSDRPDGP